MIRALPHLLLATAAALTFTGCGKKAEPKAPEPAVEKAPEPITYTLGEVHIQPLPGDIQLRGIEVLLMERVSDDAKQLITRQNTILKALTTPPKAPETETAATPDLGIPPRDAERLTSELERLKGEMPEPIESVFTAGGSRRSYISRQSLHARFQDLVQKISLEDLEGTINPISKEMENVYGILKTEEESTPSNSPRVYQARADIAWMAAFSDYMQGYRRVVLNYDSLRRRAAFQARRTGGTTARAPASPQDQWTGFRQQDGARFDATVMRTTTGAEFLESPGSFRIEGTGTPAVRLETSIGPIFLQEDSPLAWVSFSNVTTETILPGGTNSPTE